MKIRGPGRFDVSPGELITVAIRKSMPTYAASVSPLEGAEWNPSPDPPAPPGLSTHGAFTAPNKKGAVVTFDIVFDFPPDAGGGNPEGDFYTVVIRGKPDEDTRTQTIFPPGMSSRFYEFDVV